MEPFAQDPEDRVGSLGEKALLGHIRSWLGNAVPPEPYGMGDDCAVLPDRSRDGIQVATVDALVYERHFDDGATGREAGAKLVKRNLSDLAAMGARAEAGITALMMPGDTSIRWLAGFCEGMREEALRWNLALVGGDLTETDGFLGATLSVWGRTQRVLTRKGAKVGDSLWVTGELGGSLGGHHLHFLPRIPEGLFLAEQAAVVACMDLTDGLGKDLPELLPKDGAALLFPGHFPRREGVQAGLDGLRSVFDDGEDYELVFGLEAGFDPVRFEALWRNRFETRLSCLGRVVERTGSALFLDGERDGAALVGCEGIGYEHFGKIARG